MTENSSPSPAGTARRFRKKPVVIDAFQWNPVAKGVPGERHPAWDALDAWLVSLGYKTMDEADDDDDCPMWLNGDESITIPTLEGDMRCDIGDWIIRGVKGEFYPCKPDIFALTYEPAPSSASPEPTRTTPDFSKPDWVTPCPECGVWGIVNGVQTPYHKLECSKRGTLPAPSAPPAPRHVCGVAGFDGMQGDVCPACSPPAPLPSADRRAFEKVQVAACELYSAMSMIETATLDGILDRANRYADTIDSLRATLRADALVPELLAEAIYESQYALASITRWAELPMSARMAYLDQAREVIRFMNKRDPS